MKLLAIIPLCIALSASGATYYVATTGNDTTGNGSEGTPWRTIQKAADTMVAGDTVLVAPGNYGEYVSTKAAGPITFRANPANNPASQVITRQFRVKHTQITIEGFNLTGGSDINNAAVRVEPPSGTGNGSSCLVTNNTIRDGVFVISTNASFGSNFVHITDGSFTSAGFTNGSLVFFGADSMWAYTNHNSAHTVLSNSADGLTMYVTDALTADSGTNYWGVFYAGGANLGYYGVYLVAGSGAVTGPTNCVIAGNTFSNLFGVNIQIYGDRNIVSGNTIRAAHGMYVLQPQGSDNVIRNNLVLDNPNLIFFTPGEMNSIAHPQSGSYFDFQMNVLAQFQTGATNLLVERNWFQGCDNQLSQFAYRSNSWGVTLRSNVFIGMQQHGSMSANNLTVDHNTFYRDGFWLGESIAIGFGGTGGQIQTNLAITSNAFIDVGSKENANIDGSYTVTDYQTNSASLSNNFVTTYETAAWKATIANPPGIAVNGGSPLLYNPLDPLGPDGLPFTADDGLRPLPGSPMTNAGALGALPSGVPYAHFRVLGLTNWQDATGTNFDTAWSAKKPHERTADIRPWDTAEAIGRIPLTATFTATNSIDAATYHWVFSDGRTEDSLQPNITHTFLTPGTVTVALTVTNSSGTGSTTYSNAYRLLAQTNSTAIWFVSTNGSDSAAGTNAAAAWRTLAKSVAVVTNGGYVSVGPGNYDEYVDVPAVGTNRAVWMSYAAHSSQWNVRRPNCTFDGFLMDRTNLPANASTYYLYSGANGTRIVNGLIKPATPFTLNVISNKAYGVYGAISGNLSLTNGPSNCEITNTVFDSIDQINVNFDGGQSNLILGNTFKNGQLQSDAIRCYGQGHRLIGNLMTNAGWIVENHIDFIQMQGPQNASLGPITTNNWVYVKDLLVDGNTVVNCNGSPGIIAWYQYETNSSGAIGSTPASMFTNVVYQNNQFINLPYSLSFSMGGVKLWNNLFAHVSEDASGTSHAILFGGGRGDSRDCEVLNNVFFECGASAASSKGWYANGYYDTNIFLLADFNYVAGSNYAAKVLAPPDNAYRWAVTGTETHGINGGDPLFVAAASANYRVPTNSILALAGTNLTARFTIDAAGATRPSSGNWTIGPFEPAATITTSTNQPPDVPVTNTNKAGLWLNRATLHRGAYR